MYNSFGSILDQTVLNEISGRVPKDTMDKLFSAIIIKDSKSMDRIVLEIVNNGYSLVNMIQFFDNYIKISILPSKTKSLLSILLTEIDNDLIKGSDEYIGFMKLVYNFAKLI